MKKRSARNGIVAAWVTLHATVALAAVTITTYYSSPRAVFRFLRVGSNSPAAPAAQLQVVKPVDDGTLTMRVDDQPGDTSPFVVDQTGNVGIGVVNPSHKLHVRSQEVSGGVELTIDNANPNRAPRVQFGTPAGIEATVGYTSSGDYFLIDHLSTPEPDWVILPDGRMGIANIPSNRLQQLHILDTPASASHAMHLHSTYQNPGESQQNEMMFTNASFPGGAFYAGLRADHFAVRSDPPGPADLDNYFRVETNGNIGIGPDARYNINRPGSAAPASKLEVFANGDSGATTAFHLMNFDTDTLLAVRDDGGVGIGTASPAAKLQVIGAINANGNPCPSDIRFKTDIVPITGTLAKIDAVRSVSYTRSNLYRSLGYPENGQTDVGVIGQEIFDVFPELVHTVGKEGYLAVDYSRLSVVLLEAAKELKAVVVGQNVEIDALSKAIQVLESQLGKEP